VEPGLKPSPTNPDLAVYAFAKTDAFMAELLSHENPTVVALAEARLGERSTVEGARLQRFMDIGSRGSLPIPLTVSGAHTHRYAGGEKINLQNLPKRGGRDLTLRRAIIPPEGHVIVAADSSQIEVRVLAYFAGHQTLLADFVGGVDPYITQAAQTYNRPTTDIIAEHAAGAEPGKTQRAVAKESVLSAGYQCGFFTLRERLRVYGVHITEAAAREAIAGYRSTNLAIVRMWETCRRALDVMVGRAEMQFGGPTGDLIKVRAFACVGRTDVSPYIELPDGNRIWYHGLTSTRGPMGPQYSYFSGKVRKDIYGGKFTENIVQALAFAILKWQAIQIQDAGVPIHLNVHDEWVSVVPTEQTDHALAQYKKWMAVPPPWAPGLPLACTAGVADNYGDV
jgi:DNA polymerase